MRIMGVSPRRFRAPRYDVDDRVLGIASRLGLSHTRGDVTPPDWGENYTSPQIATFVLQCARSGTIVGLHDGVPANKARSAASHLATVLAVETIVPNLMKHSFQCVTASQLLQTPSEGVMSSHPTSAPSELLTRLAYGRLRDAHEGT